MPRYPGADSPQDSDWWEAMRSAAAAAEALDRFVRGTGPQLARAPPPCPRSSEVVSTKDTLRDELTPATAPDVLLTLCGDSTNVQLRTDRGWTHDQVVHWIAAAAPITLLGDSTGRPLRRRPRDGR